MSFNTTFANDLLKLILNATAIANIADNAASSPLTNLYIALHTADPGAGGDQTASEAAYTSYARVAKARTSGGFTVTGAVATPAADITFPAGTGGGGTATYWSVGTASTGTGKVLVRGTISPSIVMGAGVTPIIDAASTLTLGT